MVEQTVEDGGSHHGIAEDGTPLADRSVRGEQHAVVLADGLTAQADGEMGFADAGRADLRSFSGKASSRSSANWARQTPSAIIGHVAADLLSYSLR